MIGLSLIMHFTLLHICTDIIFSMQCFFDTPGLMLNSGGIPYRDVKARVESAWSSVNLYEVLIVIFDVHRHITK
jgi:hypothetical protein